MLGGALYEEGYAVEQTADGGYVISGSTQSFGPGYQAIYLIKTDANGNSNCNESTTATVVTAPRTLINFAPAQVLSPATVEHSAVTTIGFGGNVTSLCTTVGVPSVSNGSADAIIIYPNPASTHLTVESVVGSQWSVVSIYNAIGQEILHSTFDISSLPCGLYYLHLFDAKGALLKAEKVVKE